MPQTEQIKKILLVDDDPDDCYLLTEALTQLFSDISLDYVHHFLDAMEYLLTTRPDLIFLDLNMPYKNGFVALTELKADEVFRQIPVIVFSNSDNPRDIKLSYEKGAALYITKPISYKELLQSLQQVIEKDWSRPAAITAKYYINGQYHPFRSEAI